jgi:zinc D-Ala-D-Ala dipeptidase
MNNKILTGSLKIRVLAVFFLSATAVTEAQKLPLSAYGLPFINQVSLFEQTTRDNPEKQMISLRKITRIRLDLRYAGKNNFLHKNLYGNNINTTFLRKRVYQALDSVSQKLAKLGIVLVIFDAYRPYSVTEELWTQVQDERYAASPVSGSGHNRGIAVDLTLADSKTGQLLAMPTGFDNFSDTAHQDFEGISAELRSNRSLLRRTMEEFGFIPLTTEWWHFSWPDPEKYEVLDLSFRQLDQLQP